ncbi:hypothetical protein HG535_0C02900 [Zygotorulaspora mrakii]|uniref:Protein NBA1 n=1 Tax=Zygotorulaspora mrakii TaxID=42260 RepID=A0A7H9AZZ1_ZYGMR|nr:uncharacterized protein HG535_0C02900 [Zygotorulaspora mrakii]QLG71938.1 hypothetical protein HG535_0C02900 [Zygotorulaspora mrakii]
MAMYTERSPQKVMLNSQRLSAMIDSLNDYKDDDEHILKSFKSTSPYKEIREIEQLGTPKAWEATGKMMSPGGGQSSTTSFDNRHSMISNYSGVVHEGVEVSYIVQNQGTTPPSLPALPSQKALDEQEEVVVRTIPNAKAVSRLDSTASTESATSNYSEKTKTVKSSGDQSLRLLPVNRRQMAASSIGSGNLASESGSSYYQHIKDEEKDQVLQKINSEDLTGDSAEIHNKNATTGTDSSDNYSIATSIIPPLSTSVQGKDEGSLPVRSETNSFNPTIPPRNKNRPNSRLFIRDTLDDIESQLMEQMKDPIAMTKNSAEITRTSSTTNKSDTYFSAASFQEHDDQDIHEDMENSVHVDPKNTSCEDQTYLQRPLPTVPGESGLDRDSTIRAKSSSSRKTTKDETKSNASDYEDQFEDIEDPDRVNIDQHSKNPRGPSKKISRKGQSTKKKDYKKRQEIRSFDVDTLSQLLNVTKGTLIGAEFANLGIKVEEKRALERLVDSLSRLTADMVLDPERYQEGLKRLDKATRALEGF